MKRLKLPKNKFLRLIVYVSFLSIWTLIFIKFLEWHYYSFYLFNYYLTYLEIIILYLISTSFLIILIFKGEEIFDRTKKIIKKNLLRYFKMFEPKIYTTTSNADELKKYSDLRDQGIITEEEFQSKKKKLLDL